MNKTYTTSNPENVPLLSGNETIYKTPLEELKDDLGKAINLLSYLEDALRSFGTPKDTYAFRKQYNEKKAALEKLIKKFQEKRPESLLFQSLKDKDKTVLDRLKNTIETTKNRFNQFTATALKVERSNPAPSPPLNQGREEETVGYQQQVDVLSLLQEQDPNALLIADSNKAWQDLESDLRDLQEVYKDVAVLVEEQGEVLTHAENNTAQADTDIEKGVGALDKAYQYQRKSRKKILILILLIICVVGVILTGLLLFLWGIHVI